jgi:xanthine dehydrogenase accessory factor
MTDLLAEVERLRGDRTPFVLATVVRVERPTSAKAGDRAIVRADGTLAGFVGGTCAESTVRLQGLRLLATGESTLLRITPADPALAPASQPVSDPPDPSAEGMVTVANPCLSGGTLEIFLEAMLPPPLVYVLGDAPVARALAAAGTAIGYDIRTSTDVSEAVPPDADAVVVASHGRDEPPVLTAALRAGVPYVALVASRRRGTAVLAGLDVTDEQRARVHTPAGLDIGARTAGEVAVSILAEIIAGRPRTAMPAGPPMSAAVPAVEPAAEPPTVPASVGPTVAVDPVCGMSVAVTSAAPQLEHTGRTWYFCGTGCRDAAAADPERYLVSRTAG